MTRWEYLTFGIEYDRRQHKTWVVEQPDGEPLVGLNAILDAYGSSGWELVSLEAERHQVYVGFGKYSLEPASYRATFKRPAG